MPRPDIQELMRLHLKCSALRDELLEDCRRLTGAGKLKEARRALKAAEEIEARLKELEAAVKPKGPSSA